mgnify:CR=1 FL=1
MAAIAADVDIERSLRSSATGTTRSARREREGQGPAPCLGQHSFEVLSEVVKLSDEEIAEAYATGIVT